MPSRMCLSTIHNTKGILHASNGTSTNERWEENSCAMDSLYDIQLISQTVPVILDNSDAWFQVLSEGKRLGKNGIMHVKGVSRAELKENRYYSNALLINRTASPLAWFAECKDRKNRRSVRLPYSLLPKKASKRLRDAADKIKELLGDYDAIHVRRGDRLKTRTDKSGVKRSQFPHLDRDTQPQFIQKRIAKWVPPGRTLFIASNERKPGFFTPLSSRYKLAYSSNYSYMLDPLIENNYQLFMVERLIFQDARTFIKTFKEDEGDLFLTDDPKKTSNNWQIPVYTEEKEN
ncbi:plant/protein [Rhynchospora pubera]|uniref:Plant/protein n=1 Tax=Rhynchospora pubera TaxID=906938 RepID=A0AAV8FER9_9POAL|nr:plant/protein [Rhynchospora pubera]